MIIRETEHVKIAHHDGSTLRNNIVCCNITEVQISESLYIQYHKEEKYNHHNPLTATHPTSTYVDKWIINLKTFSLTFTNFNHAQSYFDILVESDLTTPIEEQLPELFL